MRRRGVTLLELLAVVAVLSVITAIGLYNWEQAHTRALVVAGRANLRTLQGAMELYHVDRGKYPAPAPTLPDDPYGVVSFSALRALTTPVAYLSSSVAFRDPFGTLKLQFGSGGGSSSAFDDPFAPPTPGYNSGQSILYFYYPAFADLIHDEGVRAHGYSLISIGPDKKDSFITYYPFPASLPSAAQSFGIHNVHDTVYDPTNGTNSGGDLAIFGGAVPGKHIVGGGEN